MADGNPFAKYLPAKPPSEDNPFAKYLPPKKTRREVLAEVAMQPVQAAANIGTLFAEGALRNLSRLRPTLPAPPGARSQAAEPVPAERLADYLREKREQSQAITAPETGIGKAASLASNLAAQALPAVAGGAGLGTVLGGAASAALQASAGRDASIVGTLSDFFPQNETLRKIADSPALRPAFDVAADVGLAGLGSKVSKVAQAKRVAKEAAKAGVPTASQVAAETAIKQAQGIAARASRPIGGIAARTLATRPGQSAVVGGTGAVLSQSEDEDLRYTGEGLMALAAAHAIGMPRIRAAGGATGDMLVKSLSGHKYGERLLNTLSLDILADPKLKVLREAFEEGTALGHARAAELSKMAGKFGPEVDRMLSDIVEKESISGMTTDDTAILGIAERIAKEFEELGELQVREGILAPGQFEKYRGQYLPRTYAEFEGARASGIAQRPAVLGPRRPEITPAKPRREIPLERRAELGEIREASFRTAAGVEKGYRNLAAARLFRGLREMPGSLHPEYESAFESLLTARQSGVEDAIEAAKRNLRFVSSSFDAKSGDYVRLKDSPKLGALQGAVVRRDVADYLNGIEQLPLGKKAGGFLSYWKRMHTIMNVPTHVGNVASNVSIAHMTGVPLWEQPVAMARAIKDYNAYGPVTRFLAESGVLERGLPTAGEAVPRPGHSLKTILRELSATTRPETRAVLQKQGIEPISTVAKYARKVSDRMESAYAKEDGLFRVMVFQKMVANGMPQEQAGAFVNKAFVDYTTRSPLLGTIKNTVSPFIMFPVRAIPFMTAQIIEHPVRWATLAAVWGGMDQYSQRKVGKVASEDLRPDLRRSKRFGYLAPGFTQLPFEGEGGEKYGIDVARWTPFSAVTGAPAPGSLAFATLGTDAPGIIQPSGPYIDIGAKLTGTDPFTGEKFIKPGMDRRDKTKALTRQVAGLALPSMLSFHVPRVVGNLQDADRRSAAINALGLIGTRPQVVTPGRQSYFEGRDFETERNSIMQMARKDLRDAKSEKRRDAVIRRAEERMEALRQKYEKKAAEQPPSTPNR